MPLPCRFLRIGCLDMKVQGYVTPEFIGAKKAFVKNFENGNEVGASVAAYYNGKLVVDLQGGYADREAKRKYDEDTLQIVFSSTKVMSSIVIAYLVDRGLLNYDEKISTYWPEFAQGNKENVTLLDLVNHRAGVNYIDKSEFEDIDKLAKILADQPHLFDGVPVRAYHAVTRGWYLNEIVRRVDPKHRTIGQIISEEILKQYDLEFHLSLPPNLVPRVANIYTAPFAEKFMLMRNLLLDLWNKKISISFILNFRDDLLIKTFNQTISPDFPTIFTLEEVTKFEEFAFECPSALGFTNAKSIAKLGAVITNNGRSLNDKNKSKPLLSKNTIDLMSTKLPIAWDHVIKRNFTPSVGGFVYLKFPGIEDVEFLGWGGFGGSIFVWNQELGISFGYAMNGIWRPRMNGFIGDERGYSVLKEIVNVVKKLKNDQSDSSSTK
ncbi:15001_t:CDS:2 [Dentiscutata heterogama]|uniref:15001_t:CDS:1 n=1 Tax=Dentiscutata heterogama TaxID=1316150 RepID=A0ACA9KK68_9GLOM|nr:15001_t:CDS:2 [Dentiscutata heterogama]